VAGVPSPRLLWRRAACRIEASCDILTLSAEQDYRRVIMHEAAARFEPLGPSSGGGGSGAAAQGQQQGQPLYFWPLGREADERLHAAWRALTGSQPGSSAELQVRPRRLPPRCRTPPQRPP
jgi:predicted ATPase